MPRMQREARPGQGTMFEYRDHDGMAILEPKIAFEAALEERAPETTPPSTVYGEPGSYVDVQSRAKNLRVALKGFSQSNHYRGLSRAIPYKLDLQARYKNDTAKKQKEAQQTAEEFLKEAKHHFWQAIGYEALHAAEVFDSHEVERQAAIMWKEFFAKYGHAGQSRERKKLAKQLEEAAES